MTGRSLEERCAALGILPAYRDYTGTMRRSPDSTTTITPLSWLVKGQPRAASLIV